jgi:hypothetical protein
MTGTALTLVCTIGFRVLHAAKLLPYILPVVLGMTFALLCLESKGGISDLWISLVGQVPIIRASRQWMGRTSTPDVEGNTRCERGAGEKKKENMRPATLPEQCISTL